MSRKIDTLCIDVKALNAYIDDLLNYLSNERRSRTKKPPKSGEIGWWSYSMDGTEPLVFADFHVDGSAFLRDWISYVVLPALEGK